MKQWNETSLQLLLCLALERGRPHDPTQKWPLLTILSISKDYPRPLYNAYNKLSIPLPFCALYNMCGRPQINIAIYRVSRYFFTIFIVDEILSIARHYYVALRRAAEDREV